MSKVRKEGEENNAREGFPPDSSALPEAVREAMDARFAVLRAEMRDYLEALSGRPKPLLKIPDLATYFQKSDRSVERIIASGQLRPLWVGRERRFTSAAVEAYLKACARQGGPNANGRGLTSRRRSR